MSAGAAMKVALDEARTLGKGTVVALLPDGGERYLSTSLFVSDTVPEPLRFHNTLSGQIEKLEPVSPGKVTIYSCGPSLDGPPDLGLCRRLVFSDVLRRYLEYRGYQVKHAMNLGDIDDRTVRECLKSGKNLREFTAHWEKVFFESLDALRVKRRATLSQGQRTRRRHGRTNPQPFGKRPGLRKTPLRLFPHQHLSRLRPAFRHRAQADADATSSTNYDYYEKDNPGDFALFKRPTLAELKAGIFWPTPWGNARPGWHVECACMAVGCLGQPIDIHTASTDLTFPHGDNEIAIARGLQDKPLAKLWMHCEVVMAEGKKISRAAGNDLTLAELLEQGISGAAVRYWLLATHYRTVLNYSAVELHRAANCVARLSEFVARLNNFAASSGDCPNFRASENGTVPTQRRPAQPGTRPGAVRHPGRLARGAR